MDNVSVRGLKVFSPILGGLQSRLWCPRRPEWYCSTSTTSLTNALILVSERPGHGSDDNTRVVRENEYGVHGSTRAKWSSMRSSHCPKQARGFRVKHKWTQMDSASIQTILDSGQIHHLMDRYRNIWTSMICPQATLTTIRRRREPSLWEFEENEISAKTCKALNIFVGDFTWEKCSKLLEHSTPWGYINCLITEYWAPTQKSKRVRYQNYVIVANLLNPGHLNPLVLG